MPDLPKLYVSFAPGDESWADRVRVALHCIGHQERLVCFDVRDIVGGEDENSATERMIDEAAAAVILVSFRYLTSTRVKEIDVPRLMDRRSRPPGMPVLVLLISPCPWKTVAWLKGLQMLPRGARALSGGDAHQIDLDLTDLAYEVNARLE
jgi:hypothetical protein